MSTVIRPKLSKRNPYYIGDHRYYELKHFCLQYFDWQKDYNTLSNCGSTGEVIFDRVKIKNFNIDDRTGDDAVILAALDNKMTMVKKAAYEADIDLSSYIFRAVTEGLSFTSLKGMLEIPCERDMYYDRYRKFFYILDKIRD